MVGNAGGWFKWRDSTCTYQPCRQSIVSPFFRHGTTWEVFIGGPHNSRVPLSGLGWIKVKGNRRSTILYAILCVLRRLCTCEKDTAGSYTWLTSCVNNLFSNYLACTGIIFFCEWRFVLLRINDDFLTMHTK